MKLFKKPIYKFSEILVPKTLFSLMEFVFSKQAVL